MIQSSGEKKELSDKYAELVEFLRNNLPEGAKRMVDKNRELMSYEVDGRLALHWACSGGCLEFVQLAVSNDNDLVTKADDSGFTPLMIAVSANRVEVVKYLLSFPQSDVNHKNHNGQTTLFYAASKNNIQLVKLLLENGAQVNEQDKYGNCPLHRAASQGHLEIIKLLISQKGVRVDLTDREGNTALHMAAEDNNDSAVIMLVRAGADINRQNKEEKTPLQLVQSAELRRKMTESAAH